jgi:hypothetical protein
MIEFERELAKEELEKREKVELENHALYTGEWIKGTQIRQGQGCQVWPDGSIYEGYWK